MVSRKQRPQLLVAAHVTDARGRILLARHATHWLWHLPDGGVRFGETMHDALFRSFHEDFGQRLTVLSPAPWLLTETIGNPTPMDIPLVLRNQLPRADLPYPIAPQKWHFRQSIEYSITANWAVFDVASKHRALLGAPGEPPTDRT